MTEDIGNTNASTEENIYSIRCQKRKTALHINFRDYKTKYV